MQPRRKAFSPARLAACYAWCARTRAQPAGHSVSVRCQVPRPRGCVKHSYQCTHARPSIRRSGRHFAICRPGEKTWLLLTPFTNAGCIKNEEGGITGGVNIFRVAKLRSDEGNGQHRTDRKGVVLRLPPPGAGMFGKSARFYWQPVQFVTKNDVTGTFSLV